MALAKMPPVTKWVMARATEVIVTNALAAVAIIPASVVDNSGKSNDDGKKEGNGNGNKEGKGNGRRGQPT